MPKLNTDNRIGYCQKTHVPKCRPYFGDARNEKNPRRTYDKPATSGAFTGLLRAITIQTWKILIHFI